MRELSCNEINEVTGGSWQLARSIAIAAARGAAFGGGVGTALGIAYAVFEYASDR